MAFARSSPGPSVVYVASTARGSPSLVKQNSALARGARWLSKQSAGRSRIVTLSRYERRYRAIGTCNSVAKSKFPPNVQWASRTVASSMIHQHPPAASPPTFTSDIQIGTGSRFGLKNMSQRSTSATFVHNTSPLTPAMSTSKRIRKSDRSNAALRSRKVEVDSGVPGGGGDPDVQVPVAARVNTSTVICAACLMLTWPSTSWPVGAAPPSALGPSRHLICVHARRLSVPASIVCMPGMNTIPALGV